jgi:hypothetical protein
LESSGGKLDRFIDTTAADCLYSPGQEWNAVNEEVRSVLKDYPNLKLTHGRKVRRASYSYHIRYGLLEYYH